jgi:hypothetical protein
MEQGIAPIGFALAAQMVGMPFDAYDGDLHGYDERTVASRELVCMLNSIATAQQSFSPDDLPAYGWDVTAETVARLESLRDIREEDDRTV